MMADTNISSLSFSFPSTLFDNIVRIARKIMNHTLRTGHRNSLCESEVYRKYTMVV